MCDMQKMPTREDASCEEDNDMNFATFSTVGGGTHFVTAGGQLQKIQQNVTNNGGTLQQVVGMVGGVGGVGGVSMGEGVQYVRALDGATLQHAPQLISVPIQLPGAKPGDPQPTVQIQVLSPSMLQQQPKYQMQIPIQGLQGFQQGNAVLTLAYSPENNEAGGIQLLGNTLPEGVQVLQMPQEMQVISEPKQEAQQIQHQVFITPNNQIIINNVEDGKVLNNNNTVSNNNNNGNPADVVIKEECDDNMNDDESSQGTETSSGSTWQAASNSHAHADLIKYLNTLQPQQAQALPLSLQQFLKLNPSDNKKVPRIEIEVTPLSQPTAAAATNSITINTIDTKDDSNDAVLSEDGSVLIPNKKKKKYKKKPPRPARPKPGQVVIATAADGTPIFCCPECQMAYPEKEQLEMHLIVHKIERRFICGICGAGLKRKEHLERHKLGHNPERPFVCGVCMKGFKRREHLNLHTVIHSGVKTELCGQCGKGFYRKDHLRKHTRSHEHRRARDEASGESRASEASRVSDASAATVQPAQQANNTILPEITIHVPTSANVNVPVQINIPQHVVSSLAAAQQQQQQQQQVQFATQQDAQAALDAMLASHS